MLAVLRDGRGAIGSDGQVTLGNTAVKHGAVKVRRLFEGKVLVGMTERFLAPQPAADGAELVAEDPRTLELVSLAERLATFWHPSQRG